MTKTLVAIDFDGVISPVDHDRDFTLEEGWKQFDFGFLCDVHESVVDLLQTLHKTSESSDSLDVVWNSSWAKETSIFEERSDGAFPHFDYLPVGIERSKSEALFQKIEEGGYTRFVALEDSVSASSKIRNIAKKNPELEALIIKPQLEIGLTPAHIQKVLSFVKL